MALIPSETVSYLSEKTRELSMISENMKLILKKSYQDFDYQQVTKDFTMKLFQQSNEKDQEFSSILFSKSDVIPNEYEGGFKVWEGLFDLVDYLRKSNTVAEIANSTNSINICDLGCGSGLLSIFIGKELKTRFPEIQFQIFLQDYNESVLKFFTIPNIVVNDDSLLKNCHFISGDWQQVCERFVDQQIKFDLIVTAETIYQELNYRKLCDLFATCIRQPNGQILVASKSHYFGIGGGTYSFLDYIANDHYEGCRLRGTVVEEIDEPLVRNVIQLKPIEVLPNQ